jgi:hypothetical protein
MFLSPVMQVVGWCRNTAFYPGHCFGETGGTIGMTDPGACQNQYIALPFSFHLDLAANTTFFHHHVTSSRLLLWVSCKIAFRSLAGSLISPDLYVMLKKFSSEVSETK